jgi:hypothetical protein
VLQAADCRLSQTAPCFQTPAPALRPAPCCPYFLLYGLTGLLYVMLFTPERHRCTCQITQRTWMSVTRRVVELPTPGGATAPSRVRPLLRERV